MCVKSSLRIEHLTENLLFESVRYAEGYERMAFTKIFSAFTFSFSRVLQMNHIFCGIMPVCISNVSGCNIIKHSVDWEVCFY